MKIVLKAVLVLFVLAIGVLLGIYFLAEFELIKFMLWLLACVGVGRAAYAADRYLDRKFPDQK
jgi:4-hydroxybenzoate polyprenyltransferase